jgi:hypothetical protein
MSSYHIDVIPDDPFFVPPEHDRAMAECLIKELVETNHESGYPPPEVETTVTDGPQLVTCMGNFESVHCPQCDAELDTAWWQDRMDDDFDGTGFTGFTRFSTPCCGSEADLNSLRYNLPQGFARFVLSCREPGFAEYPKDVMLDLERLLRCKLRQIFVRI